MVTAQEFSQIFEQVSCEQMPNLLQNWAPRPRMTRYVKEEMMPAIASGLHCYRELEYKRIDVVFKMLSTSEIKHSQNTEIVAAIEHENDFGKSYQEILKLCNFNAQLGVLITYASQFRRHQKIAEFAKIISAAKDESDNSEQGEILIIFGPYGMTPPKSLVWEHFLYRGNCFQQLNP